jgi:hypothetical protein
MSDRSAHSSPLTPDSLRALYEGELLTETEIGLRYGISQSKVNRLRKRWGIPTLGKTGRLAARLPQLTQRQEELLLGTLLGDGHMNAPSDASARLSEQHCKSQEAYLRWKVDLLGPYVSRIADTVKEDGDRTYEGVVYTTHSCAQLRPWYDLFYHHGRRIFPKDLHERITPFALAVWYMDDGSILREFHPRIAFGLSSLSLRRACRALRALGFKPQYQDEGSISFPGQDERFFEMVAPHMPECMAYKVPTLTARKEGDRNAKALTPEKATTLYEGGMSLAQIAELYGVGTSTVRRRLDTLGVERRPMGRRRQSYSLDAATVALANFDSKLWKGLGKLEQGKWVDDIYAILSKTSFPYPELPEDPEREYEKLVQLKVSCEDGWIRPLSYAGLKLCYPFFPNRYKARYETRVSAFEGWHSEKHLRSAIRFQLRYGDPVVPHRVLKALTANCRTPTAFRPTVAKYIYETYCPEGGRVWDPCAGYGGRLLGALAVGVRYIATDVEPETIEGNRKLAEALGKEASLHLSPAEEFDPGKVDLVFTSPPYFDREQYSQRPGQSWIHYGDLRSWVEGFLAPVVKTAWESLSSGQYLILNFADIKVKGGAVPLVAEAVSVAQGVGFTHTETLEMPLSRLNRNAASEPVLVFQKRV